MQLINTTIVKNLDEIQSTVRDLILEYSESKIDIVIEIKVYDQTKEALPIAPSITSMKVVSDVGAMCDEINIDPMGYVEPSPSDNCTH